MKQEFSDAIKAYKDVIAKFKNRSDVYSGVALAWKGGAEKASLSNTPFGIGDGLGTTGWCVSASEALISDNIFQLLLRFRNAKAKLISIDIKEQYWGYCYTGSQNKWHTAILLEDSGFKFVIDITCRQFGDKFIDTDIWDFESWQSAFRSPLCKHNITDFENNHISVVPLTVKEPLYKNNIPVIEKLHKLKNFTGIGGDDRVLLTKFLLEDFDSINSKLILGNLRTSDLEYLEDVTEILKALPFKQYKTGYTVLPFASKSAMKNWVSILLDKNNQLPQYLLLSDSVMQSCTDLELDFQDLFCEYKMGNTNNKTYLILEFDMVYGVDTGDNLLLTHGLVKNIEKVENCGKLSGKEYNTSLIKFSAI